MKLACVVHRFGADIAGGSEAHCRVIAERLAERHDVTVLTTCAQDHVTWKNHYPTGESVLNGVRVRRFPVGSQRRLHRFREVSDLVFDGRATIAEQEQWFRENGPEVPALLHYLDAHGTEFDRILFWAYRYYPSYFGVPLVASRAVLVPTAEDDPLINAGVLRRFFGLPAGYLFLTPEEAALVGARAERLGPSAVIGCGLDPANVSVDPAPLGAAGIDTPYVLYLGRVDPNKGCDALIRHFLRYRSNAETRVPLILAGPANMPLPESPSIRALGFVDDRLCEALLAHASLLVVPSPYESLSMVLLEAWNHGVPALVNAQCDVLRGQVTRANGGLYYRHAAEFAAALDCLLARPDAARQFGAQGRDYVDREYRWPIVMQKIEALLERA